MDEIMDDLAKEFSNWYPERTFGYEIKSYYQEGVKHLEVSLIVDGMHRFRTSLRSKFVERLQMIADLEDDSGPLKRFISSLETLFQTKVKSLYLKIAQES